MPKIETIIDFRSDTVTAPTEEMRKAMYDAEVGDACRGEDPTIEQLEALSAQIMGKEDAIFVSSGTMANLVALLTHTQPGDEVVMDTEAHCYYYEVGGFAAVAGLSPRFVKSSYGVMDPSDIQEAIRPTNPHFPTPTLLWLENTHNRAGGNALTVVELQKATNVARQNNLSVHLDGARVFNAAVAHGNNVSEFASCADSISFCFSKGLSAPIGSMIAGEERFIARARKKRKLLGGDMRQSGVVAAPAIVALESMIERLAEDHRSSRLLAEGLSSIPRVVIDTPPHPTNMVYVDTSHMELMAAELSDRLKVCGVLSVAYATHRLRLVTHRHISLEDINFTLDVFKSVVESI